MATLDTIPEEMSIGRLATLVDNGPAVAINPEPYVPRTRDPASQVWGIFAGSFLSLNQPAFEALGVVPEVRSSQRSVRLLLRATDRIGAVPLRSVSTGRIAGGVVSVPRFGWTGVGSVLAQTGWAAAPDILRLPAVPGSGRETPPWVIAGPVLTRIEQLLRNMRREYRDSEQTLSRPRGRIRWDRYVRESLVRGHWDRLPCRFPELAADVRIRGMARWTVEKTSESLMRLSGSDPASASLHLLATRLLTELSDVPSHFPSPRDLNEPVRGLLATNIAMVAALEAISWVAEERGLGGGREMDGLAWVLPLDRLWEAYIEAIYRHEAAVTGATIQVGRRHETIMPFRWTEPRNRSMTSLVPDIVLQKGSSVHVVDAKYKAHLADIDEQGWRNLREEAQESHRADIHQVLAYASLFEAEEITSTLVYPLPMELWSALHERRQDVAIAHIDRGRRHIVLQLRGLPFGRIRVADRD